MFRKGLLALAFLLALPLAANATGCGTGTGTCFVVAAGGNSNSTATWTNASGGATCTCTPVAGDTIILDNAAGNLTVNAALSAGALDESGTGGSTVPYAGALAISTGITLTITSNDAGSATGATFKLVSGAQFNPGNSASSVVAFTNGTAASVATITTASTGLTNHTMSSITFNGTNGTFRLADNILAGTTSTFTAAGAGATLDASTNNVSITTGTITLSGGTTNAGTGTWTCTNGASSSCLNNSSRGTATINAGSATFVCGGGGVNGQRNCFLGGGQTYGTVTINAVSNAGYQTTIGGSATATTITNFNFASVSAGTGGNLYNMGTNNYAVTNFTCTGGASNALAVFDNSGLNGTYVMNVSGTFNCPWSAWGRGSWTVHQSPTNSFDLGGNVGAGGFTAQAPTGGGGGGFIIGG